MKENQILALLYYFPPMGSVCSNRTTHLLEGLAKNNYKISVIQAKYNPIAYDSPYPANYLNSRINVPNFDYRVLKNKLGYTAQGSFFSKKERAGLKPLLFKFLESKLGAWSIGEGGLFYIINSYLKAVQLIKKGNIKYLLTSYRPLSDLIVASLLKRRFPHLEWIADMRDYYIRYDTENYFNKTSRIQYFGKLLDKADLVLTVSEGIANKIRKDTSTKVFVSPNGFYPNTNQNLAYPKFKLSYTGSIYSFYNLDILFQSISEWLKTESLTPNDVEIHYVGRDSLVWEQYTIKYKLKDYSIIESVVPLNQARKIQSESAINLLASFSNNEYNGVVTGKLYDLIGAQKPILCTINGQLDPDLKQYFQDLNCGRIFYSDNLDINEIIGFLNEEHEKWTELGRNSNQIKNDHQLEKYSWESRINDLVQAISKIS